MALSAEASALIDAALTEDVGDGDFTTLWTVPEERRAEARIVAKAAGTIAGSEVAVEAFRRVDPSLEIDVSAPDGTALLSGDLAMVIRGSARSILTAERTALNFLQRLSGVATVTHRYVAAVEGTGARVIDTRKTTPGMRLLEKAAVVAGGGANHRVGLHDMVMIKDNHIAAAGGITAAVDAVRARNDRGLRVEVETTTLEEVREALRTGADRIMFDNMSPVLMRQAVEIVHAHDPRPETEASGGITLETIRSYAETGVDFISIGALTHSAPALDLSLQLRAAE
ncbi:carboxylating nicotinate-nucleotide diphosphorylase [Longimicrobium terrae]|uniref:Probable nicotinate-nucleotide pyrophosphorylase [carboxylating] n=1 Tax=Longimicrobium terrae TaxID=1639882 RepID=A0A841H444_9BACT|nr:carboxylating nicotinate-nucleotide diphosphorylase [Longimicrobium terrae]MBB4638409.1 nicotinate-nucleotide pyrophosphorylase (carboxylating) [Longimicrobium terrae]MBB6072748.1 nicotinate-nucleotide pyrophosphorylase (carboxylating) [Longimicrobium terrae]NNC32378.1 carboxylating nicotinate-nucleotide diphosphorylase [Longimicrobium terrae]